MITSDLENFRKMVRLSKEYDKALDPLEGIVKGLKEFQIELGNIINLVEDAEFTSTSEKEIDRIASIISISKNTAILRLKK